MRHIIKVVFFVVACAVWAVCGTVYWIAALFRALTVFSALHVYAAFTRQKLTYVQSPLTEVSDLWIRGFRDAYDAVYGTLEPVPLEFQLGRLLAEILWTALFWAGVFVATGHIHIDISHPVLMASACLTCLVVGLILGFRLGIDSETPAAVKSNAGQAADGEAKPVDDSLVTEAKPSDEAMQKRPAAPKSSL